MTTPAEAARRYRESSTTPRLVAGCSRPTMTLAGLGALKVGGEGCLVPVCSGFRGAGGGWVGGLDGGGWREMRVGTGVKVRVPPGLPPVEAGPKGLGPAWEGRLRVPGCDKDELRWGAFATFTTPPPSPPPTPPTPPTHQMDPKPAKPCPQLMHGVNQWGGAAPAALYGVGWWVVLCVVVLAVVGGGV